MYSRRVAEVLAVRLQTPFCEELDVLCQGQKAKALNYLPLTGPASRGDQVVLNTTAVELALGTGGYHFVCLNLASLEQQSKSAGHIMKLRYTPEQLRVLSVEEEASPYHTIMKQATSIYSMPVIVAELHSMLAPTALILKQKKPDVRLAYLMTDGGALPAFFSKAITVLKERGIICGTITCGHAFGGDLEAINVYSGLLAAKHVFNADVAIVCMGPGVAGTGTPFGFSGLEMGDNLNRVRSVEGRPIALPRISFADRRVRHQGISHHTLTALMDAALITAEVPLPIFADDRQNEIIFRQIVESGLAVKHSVISYDKLSLADLMQDEALCRTMGRSLKEDPAFFLAAVAAAHHVSLVLEQTASEYVVG